MTDRARTTLVLADDHVIVRSGLRMLLDSEPDFEVVAEAGDVEGALAAVARHRPRVLILDLNMPGEPSLAALPRLLDASPGTAVVVLTMQSEPGLAREALRAGALGYVLKEAAEGDLAQAVRMATEGRTYLQPELAARLAAERSDGPPGGTLTPRETEVLRLIALGHTNAEVAAQLFLSVRTIESHRASIQQKLRATTRAELVAHALRQGLVGS